MQFCSLETRKVFVISPCLRKRSIMGHVFWYCANDMVSRTLRCGIVLRPLFHCFAFHLLLRITLFFPPFSTSSLVSFTFFSLCYSPFLIVASFSLCCFSGTYHVYFNNNMRTISKFTTFGT